MSKSSQPGSPSSPSPDESGTSSTPGGQVANFAQAILATPLRVNATLQRTPSGPNSEDALWPAIRNRTEAINFKCYDSFIQRVLAFDSSSTPPASAPDPQLLERTIHSDVGTKLQTFLKKRDFYKLLAVATNAFLATEGGLAVRALIDATADKMFMQSEQPRHDVNPVTVSALQANLSNYLVSNVQGIKDVLPYLEPIVKALLNIAPVSSGDYDDRILKERVEPTSMMELIWAYWHEEGMLVQAMNAITLRFQNRRQGVQDPLAELEIHPLRPLNHFLWEFIQDEINRLSVARRAHEYHHAYGLTMYGKALSQINPADNRSRFVEAFHNLLRRTAEFYREDADTTLVSDGFALLNALKELHVILAEGAHNQFGDMPRVARSEMLIMQWLLARTELREFLGGRPMVPYQEEWMRQVDSIKRLKGWTDVSVSQFRDLAVFGEKLLLSVRYGNWITVTDQEAARNWARYWKPEVQSYVHSYLAATGVDLSVVDVGDSPRAVDRNRQPSMHLRRRLVEQRTRTTLSLPNQKRSLTQLEAAPRHLLNNFADE